VKALTLWEPWATLVAVGVKRWETRSWPTTYRGPLAIHASKGGWLKRILGVEPLPDLEDLRRLLHRHDLVTADQFRPGCVVAVVDLVDCLRSEWAVPTGDERACGDFAGGRFAWRLENVRRLDPAVPAAGARGLWDWDDGRVPAPPADAAGSLFDGLA
jgi:hypothetical protein